MVVSGGIRAALTGAAGALAGSARRSRPARGARPHHRPLQLHCGGVMGIDSPTVQDPAPHQSTLIKPRSGTNLPGACHGASCAYRSYLSAVSGLAVRCRRCRPCDGCSLRCVSVSAPRLSNPGELARFRIIWRIRAPRGTHRPAGGRHASPRAGS